MGATLRQYGEALIGVQFFETNRQWSTSPIVIGNESSFAGAIRVGLPDANLARLRAMQPHADLVILDFTMLRIAQQACMDEAEVSDVEEVFDHPRPLGAEEIWARLNQTERGVITISELGRIAHRLSQADPDHAIVFARRVCLRAGLGRR